MKMLLGMGNQSTKSVASILRSRLTEIQMLQESEQYGVLEMF